MLIRFTGKHEKEPTRGYLPWLASMLSEAGFDYPKTTLVSRLACSEKMVQIIQKHVDYIRIRDPRLSSTMLLTSIPPRSAWQNAAALLAEDYHASTYYNRKQLMQYLVETPAYTKQTKRVPLEEAFRGDLDGINAYKELDTKLDRALHDDSITTEKYKMLQVLVNKEKLELVKKYCPECYFTMRFKTKRTAVEAVPVEPFDWFTPSENGYFLSAAKEQHSDIYRNTETLYREMYISCATKITFGPNKTFFYITRAEAEQKDFLVPMTF